MRIIGGEFRSRLIEMPKGVDMRPTQDKVRQAIFNVLGNVAGANVLELFAGSGAFGIEALSRGAKYVTFVDNNSICIKTIRKNLESLNVPESSYELVWANALSVFARMERDEGKFDLVFLDPPYYKNIARKCLSNIDAYDILSQNSLVVVEHFKKDSLEFDLKTLVFEKEKQYGDTVISIFRKKRDEVQDSGLSRDI
jgi:16S rRNA (guanine(966)-N(2))-methyltransferase RsmD